MLSCKYTWLLSSLLAWWYNSSNKPAFDKAQETTVLSNTPIFIFDFPALSKQLYRKYLICFWSHPKSFCLNSSQCPTLSYTSFGGSWVMPSSGLLPQAHMETPQKVQKWAKNAAASRRRVVCAAQGPASPWPALQVSTHLKGWRNLSSSTLSWCHFCSVTCMKEYPNASTTTWPVSLSK